jgi:hypothetical protein
MRFKFGPAALLESIEPHYERSHHIKALQRQAREQWHDALDPRRQRLVRMYAEPVRCDHLSYGRLIGAKTASLYLVWHQVRVAPHGRHRRSSPRHLALPAFSTRNASGHGQSRDPSEVPVAVVLSCLACKVPKRV